LSKARHQYLSSIKYLEDKENRKIFIIDATKTIDEIYKEVIVIIAKFLNK